MNNECSAFGATWGSTFYFEYKTKNKNIHGSEIIRTIALKLKSILLSSPQTTELKYQNNRCNTILTPNNDNICVKTTAVEIH